MTSPNDPYFGLLTNPPGRYGLVDYGETKAVILTGDAIFRERAFNLFASFGSEVKNGDVVETRIPTLRTSDRVNTVWFCMPVARIEEALRYYFYGHLWRAKCRHVVDQDGDFTEAVCDTEPAAWEEACQLACDFIVQHMGFESGAIPILSPTPLPLVEHDLGLPGKDGDWN